MSSKFSRGTRRLQHPSICLKPPPGRVGSSPVIDWCPPPPPPPPPPPHAAGYYCQVKGDLRQGYGPNLLDIEVMLHGWPGDQDDWVWDTDGFHYPLYAAYVERRKISLYPEIWADQVQIILLVGAGVQFWIVNDNAPDSDPTEIYRHYLVVQSGLPRFNGDVWFTYYSPP